ncbi:Ig-like domain-containing protein [Microcystis aeruginosa]|nr:putative Ig domain-containing protein [Microcystis aeruginosa]
MATAPSMLAPTTPEVTPLVTPLTLSSPTNFIAPVSATASDNLANQGDSLLSVPLLVNPEAANFSFSDQDTSWRGTPQITQLDDLGEVLVVPGNPSERVNMVVQWTLREAAFNNEVGFFLVDALGGVEGIAPGEEGFAEAALSSPSRQTLFNSGDQAGNWREFTVAGGSRLGFYVIQNNTSANWLENNRQNQGQSGLAFFSLKGANPDDFDHSQSSHLGRGIWRFNWEDLTGGGDQDFNDVVFNIAQAGIVLPGDKGQQVPLTVEAVSQDNTFPNEMGYYLVDTPDGEINGIKPGDQGYLDAALSGDRHQVIFASGKAFDSKTFNVPSGKYLGWYLVANGTTDQAIANGENAPPVFFSFAAANEDGLNHVHAQQDSQTWTWEDFWGGGDRDFDDLVFRFSFGEPTGEPIQLPSLSIENTTVTEGNTGTEAANFTVRLSAPTNTTVTAEFTTTDGTAQAGTDYESSTGILTFAPGEVEKNIAVAVKGDTISEPTETFTVNLTGVTNAILIQGEGIGTILDNDNSPNPPDNNPPVTDADKTITLPEDSQPIPLNINPPTDIDGDTLRVSVTQLPDNSKGKITLADGTVINVGDEISINSLTSLLYTPLADVNGNGGNFVYTVSDGKGGNDSQTISFVITPENTSANNPPVTDADKTITLPEDSQPIPLNINPPTDIDGDNLTIAVTQLPDNSKGRITLADGTVINVGDEISINSLTSLLYTPLADVNGNGGNFIYTVSDGKGGSDSQTISFIINPSNLIVSAVSANNAPEFTTNPELKIIVGNDYSYDANAVDADNDTLFYSLSLAPDGLTIDNNTGVLSWQSPTIGNYNISISVEDGKGGRDTQTYNLGVVTNVIDSQPNRPPVFVSNPVVSGNINTEYRYDADATDADNDNLTYSVINAPNGLVINQNTGVVTFTPTVSGATEITLQVDDGKGGIATQKYNLFVSQSIGDNNAPIITSEPVTEILAGNNYQYQVIAEDIDGDTLTYELETETQGITIDSETGLLLFNPSLEQYGSHLIKITVKDGKGGVDVQDYILEVYVNSGFFIFTDDNDWQKGSLNNVNYNAPNQLQLNDTLATLFDHIWVALSGRGGVVKINTRYNDLDDGVTDEENFGAVLGEYQTHPDGLGGNPSRTTVDLDGDVWLGNRNENGGLADSDFPYGSVVQISANPRNANTSTGVWNAPTGLPDTFDRRPWTNSEELDTDGGTETASDSAILNYVRVPDAEAVRHVSVDRNNNLWVGGYPFGLRNFHLLDGESGEILDSFDAREIGAGGYGGLVDGNGILWSASLRENALLRYNPATKESLVINVPNSYGLAIDTNGFIWNAVYYEQQVYKIDSQGNIVGAFSTGGAGSGGLAVTPFDNNVWIANRESNTVTRLDNNGNLLATIPVGGKPTGVAVDSLGKVWVTNLGSDNVMRIDPFTNTVDLTVYLGETADPYNYSDMTGSILNTVTSPGGRWSVIQNSQRVNQEWENIVWNTEAEGSIPQGTDIIVRAKTANNLSDLQIASWTIFNNGDDLNLVGQFIEVEVTLTRESGLTEISPILSDLRLGVLSPNLGNQLPEINSTPSTNTRSGYNYTYQVIAEDQNGDRLTYTLNNAPTGMAIDNRGLITWTPTEAQIGVNAVTILVTDGRGTPVSQSFNINVFDLITNTAPSINSTPNLSTFINRIYEYKAIANDNEGDKITWTLTEAPIGMIFNSETNTIRWQPSENQVGNNRVVLEASDGKGGIDTQEFIVNVKTGNSPPKIISTPDTYAGLDRTYKYEIIATDSDNDTLRYQLINSPQGMTINENTGLIEYNPSQLGIQTIDILVSDGFGGFNSQSYQIQVLEKYPNRSPQINTTPIKVVSNGDLYQYDVEANDPENTAISYNLTVKPNGMTIDTNTGLITWQTQNTTNGDFQVTVTATDADGGIAYQNYYIRVTPNQAPIISSQPLELAQLGVTYKYDVIAKDADNDTLTYNLLQAPQGLTIDQFGRIRWQSASQNQGIYPVTIQVSDGRGGITTQTYNLTLSNNDITNPVVELGFNSNLINIGQSINFQVRATDNIEVKTLTLTANTTPLTLNPNSPNGQINTGASQFCQNINTIQ